MSLTEAGIVDVVEGDGEARDALDLAVDDWRGSWISSALPEGPPLTGGLAGLDAAPTHSGYQVLLFRHDFVLDDLPRRAFVRVASDSRHVLHLNGVPVVRGPRRAQPRRLGADVVEVGSALRVGNNTVALEVTYYGAANALWMPAEGSGELGTRAAVIAELHIAPDTADATPILIVTDESWFVRTDETSSRGRRSDVEGVPAELYDARHREVGWATQPPGAGWERATPLMVGHMAGAGRARPPADPYGPVPHIPARGQTQIRHRPQRARLLELREGAATRTLDTADHPTDRVSAAVALHGGSRVIDGRETDIREQIVEYDFGRIVVGRISIEFDAAAGAVFDIDLREHPVGAGPVARHGLRYTARGAEDHFVSMESHGLRYLAITSAGSPMPPQRALVRSIHVEDDHSPRTGGAFFRSGDRLLDAIWAGGVRTVEVNSSDGYSDCPTREQRAWVGDGVVPLEVDLLTTDDHTEARRYIWLAMSPRADGLLPMSVAGDIEAANSTSIPAWSLHWIHALWLLARHDGIDDLVLRALPVAERVLRWFEPFIDERGTLRDIPEWCFVDWSSSYTHGRSSIMTGLWARALRDFARLSEAADNLGSARLAWNRYHAARDGFEDFWDAERGLYLDCLEVDPQIGRATSQLASAIAIIAGMADESRVGPLARRLADPSRLVLRTWFATAGGFDADAAAAASLRHPDPDWHVETQIVRAQPFGAALVHEALAVAGATQELHEAIKDWGQFLTDGSDTFGEGWGWGTTAHAWSSTPTRDLVAFVTGLSPVEWGGHRWQFAPAIGMLSEVSACVPTRHGPIEVRATHQEATVLTPVPLDVIVRNKTVELAAGRWHVQYREGRSLQVTAVERGGPQATNAAII